MKNNQWKRNNWNLWRRPELPSDVEVACGTLWKAPLRNLLVCVRDGGVFGASLSSFLPTGWLCELLKRFGSSPLRHGHMKGLRRPFCSRSPAQSEEKSLDADPSKKKRTKQKCLLKSCYLHCAIYLFAMGRHPNGCRLGRSSNALYGMSSSNAGHYPASLIILIVPPYCSFLAPQSLDKPRCPWWPETNTWRSRCGFLWPRSVLFTGSAWLPSVQIRGYRQAGQGSSGTHCCVVRCPDVLRIFTQPSALSGGGGTDS